MSLDTGWSVQRTDQDVIEELVEMNNSYKAEISRHKSSYEKGCSDWFLGGVAVGLLIGALCVFIGG
jgi:hypothetical protein